ncbi:MAG TPA: hypothetical protein VL088_13040 [Pedobacter sp.]|nr:hypothetical protein [Pedobacter sp.]
MKYHYQNVSKNTVRIQLLPENPKETQLLNSLTDEQPDNAKVTELFQLAVEHYSTGSTLTKTRFMDFPKVALCTIVQPQKINQVA